MNFGRTFFPNCRKEITIEACQLLKDKAGNPQIKLSISMALDDGKQVGMPTWVGDAYDDLAKEDCQASVIKFAEMVLEEITLYLHTTAESVKPAQTLICPTLSNFQMVRGEVPKREGALAPVSLEFVAYVNGAQEHWAWVYRHFRPATVYGLFLATQADIEDKPSTDPQMKIEIVNPTYEEQRAEACSAEHDAEFADV